MKTVEFSFSFATLEKYENDWHKEKESLLQELEKVKIDKENSQKNLKDVQNEKEQKDKQIESLKLELTEGKQAIQAILSGEITLKRRL